MAPGNRGRWPLITRQLLGAEVPGPAGPVWLSHQQAAPSLCFPGWAAVGFLFSPVCSRTRVLFGLFVVTTRLLQLLWEVTHL